MRQWLLGAAFIAGGMQPVPAAAPEYLGQIKPLLAENCYQCHGATQQKHGLRLDTAAFARAGGENGPAITPGAAAKSLLVQVIEGRHAEISRMPYKKEPLAPEQIALIRAWIDAGAPAPADEQPETARHWAFVPPQRPVPPPVSQTGWARNPIDPFILARLEREGIKPSAEADRLTLIRRLSLDLLGLPPTLAEVDAFVNDRRGDAYERLVERLLNSPHYGERWGRWWLDVARYADSHGYSIDAGRQLWKYRDWVIDAFNRDLPFDQFTIEQLAGDLLPNATVEQKIATGFHRNTQINMEGGIDREQFRIESVFDRVNTTATAWLGLTIACAQCHDHKFDPVTQREYYQLFAFLNNQDEPTLELPTPAELERRSKHRQKVETAAAELKELGEQLQSRGIKPADDPDYKKREAELARLRRAAPTVTSTMVLAERKVPRETHFFIKGDFTRKGDRMHPGVPAVMHPLKPVAADVSRLASNSTRQENPSRLTSAATIPNRLDLARWLVDPANPLTARVIVNRVWQQYFGRGIVETENDFGTQGIPPTHPELLDWLATEFAGGVVPSLQGHKVTSGTRDSVEPYNALTAARWSLKHIHRLIVTSATYRQSSKARPDLHVIDPNNKLLARQNRLRLDAEIVRDVMLAASGLLSDQIGGPSVFPPQPDGVMALGQRVREWNTATGADRYRRGVYTYYWRATPHPALAVFDAPDSFSTCTRRIRSNTPLQALTLLNDRQFYEFAEALADRVLREAGQGSDADRIGHAFRLCLAREPAAGERARLGELLRKEQAAGREPREAWTTVARVLLNLDETITRE